MNINFVLIIHHIAMNTKKNTQTYKERGITYKEK